MAAGVPLHRGARLHPEQRPIPAGHAELRIEWSLTFQRSLAFRQGPFAVLGVQSLFPVLHIPPENLACDPIDLQHAVVPGHGSRLEIPIPDAQMGGGGGQLEPLRQGQKRLLTPGALGDVVECGADTVGCGFVTRELREGIQQQPGGALA